MYGAGSKNNSIGKVAPDRTVSLFAGTFNIAAATDEKRPRPFPSTFAAAAFLFSESL